MKPLQILNNVNKTYLALAVFAVLVSVFYGNTLLNGFVLDDLGQIERNANLRSFQYLPKIFTSCIWESANSGCYGRAFYYRPVHFLSAILTYQISSQPWFFHLVNLLYFFTAAFLAFVLVRMLTKHYITSVLAAVFFIVHPLNSETVNFVSAVPDLAYTAFALLTVILYIQYRKSLALGKLILVYVFYFIAILSKEPAILIPIILVSLDLLFFKFKIKDLLRFREVMRYAVFGALFLIYLLMRNAVLGVGPQFGQFSLAERIHATLTLFGQYVAKLFYPYPLALYHNFEKSSDFLSFSFLASVFAVLVFFGVLFVFIKKGKPVFAFALIWFFVFLLPVLTFLGGVGENVLSERYFFGPSIGFSLLLACLFSRAITTPRIGKLGALLALSFLLIISWLAVFPRNLEWRNNITLYTKTLRQNPDAHIVRRELGAIYMSQGEFEKAKVEFEEILNRDKDWRDITMVYKGLGDYYRITGDSEQALEYYKKSAATGHSPRDYVPRNDLGTLYMEKKEYLKAFASFCEGLQLYSESQVLQGNFNDALAFLDSEYIQEGILHEKILEEFDKSPDEKIVYRDKRCEKGSCQYAFSFQAQQFEVLPPFLITAATASGKELEVTNKGFNPETGVILLELDSKHKDQTLTFLFPTCQGIYYEAVAKP